MWSSETGEFSVGCFAHANQNDLPKFREKSSHFILTQISEKKRSF